MPGMPREDSIENIKQVITDLVSKMGIKADIEIREQQDTVVYNLRTNDTNMLIGKHGINLHALQYLARILARRKLQEELDFLIDVEDYKKKREFFLTELAQEIKRQVIDQKRAVVLKSMPAFERRVIHAVLSEAEQVETSSIGEDPNRMVVVFPRGQQPEVSPDSLSFLETEDYKVL
ncbi:MAG: hypothetical protein A3J48_02720 [Candidatus Doudnabacteria bacterium RIFCSPHIGHO2_02_FULL_46_11]|uniref:R3H domain-containing protein n=1 Tax=Candidatus Doudnabacteria bacterium RIFCSPHIGHO2_02_FULL_46_11 TaxID=1817832 RepID=A0A1F5P857_9BACT|nr:MAG: hypothetical protein A3J48_02720 [Candidatus Doudnabacteria bacterium RIFCSPHIGHO2_02_FULL_46_11]